MDHLKSAQAIAERFVNDPANHDFLAMIKAMRNGVVYGCKVRFPHALVMTLLFRTGSPKTKALAILHATRLHATNLSLFALIYKTLLILSRRHHNGKETRLSPFLSGLCAGYLVFGRHPASRSAVTQQIVIYVFARVCLGLAKLAVAPAVPRPSGWQAGYSVVSPGGGGVLEMMLEKVFGVRGEGVEVWRKRVERGTWPVFASVSWGVVMWLFTWYPDVLQPSLRSSMRYLYVDSEEWDGLRNFLWHNK